MNTKNEAFSLLYEAQSQVRRSITREGHDPSDLKDGLLTIYGLVGHALRCLNAWEKEEPKQEPQPAESFINVIKVIRGVELKDKILCDPSYGVSSGIPTRNHLGLYDSKRIAETLRDAGMLKVRS